MKIDLKDFSERVEKELKGNILVFWMKHMVDYEHGGFYGRISNDLTLDKNAPKGLVLNARILWTFAAAYRLFGSNEYLMMADRAYEYLMKFFWDHTYGGTYWMLGYTGNPIDSKKQIYGQAFTIYALAEYFRATGNQESLNKAIELYNCLEKYVYDPVYKGYLEGYTREWNYSQELALSKAESPEAKKTMNTHLHLLEAYTNLLRVWENDGLRKKLTELLEVVVRHIINHGNWHFNLFFDEKWNSLGNQISFGHDIEGSWLLVEAAEVIGDADMLKYARQIAVNMAEAVLREGVDEDGSVFYEADPQCIYDKRKIWWPQSEAVVGLFNAYQITGDEKFLMASYKCWSFIEENIVDRKYGEWLERGGEGMPDPNDAKADPWKCPYHNSRACFEILIRIREE